MQVYTTSTLFGFAQSVPYTSPIAFFSSAPAASFESWLPSHAAQSYWLSDHIWKRYSCKFQNFLVCSWLKIGRLKVSSDQCVLFLLFPFGFAFGLSLQQQTKHMCHQTTSRNICTEPIYIYICALGANQTELTNRQHRCRYKRESHVDTIWFDVHTQTCQSKTKKSANAMFVFLDGTVWRSRFATVSQKPSSAWHNESYVSISIDPSFYLCMYLSVNLSIYLISSHLI